MFFQLVVVQAVILLTNAHDAPTSRYLAAELNCEEFEIEATTDVDALEFEARLIPHEVNLIEVID
jgi:hypothetical protein